MEKCHEENNALRRQDVRFEERPDPEMIELGKVFDFVGSLDQVPDGYRAMNDRKAINAMLEF